MLRLRFTSYGERDINENGRWLERWIEGGWKEAADCPLIESSTPAIIPPPCRGWERWMRERSIGKAISLRREGRESSRTDYCFDRIVCYRERYVSSQRGFGCTVFSLSTVIGCRRWFFFAFRFLFFSSLFFFIYKVCTSKELPRVHR